MSVGAAEFGSGCVGEYLGLEDVDVGDEEQAAVLEAVVDAEGGDGECEADLGGLDILVGLQAKCGVDQGEDAGKGATSGREHLHAGVLCAGLDEDSRRPLGELERAVDEVECDVAD